MSPALATLMPAQKTAKAEASKSLRVNKPDDHFEREADRVADAAVHGAHLAPWSLSTCQASDLRRDSDQEPSRESPHDISKALAEAISAFLKSEAGRSIAEFIAGKGSRKKAHLVETSTGAVVSGATALAAIAEISKAHKDLPAQFPAISLDSVHPGLSLKVNAHGSLHSPIQGLLVLTFNGIRPTRKKDETKENDRADSSKHGSLANGETSGHSGPLSAKYVQDAPSHHRSSTTSSSPPISKQGGTPFASTPSVPRVAPIPKLLHPTNPPRRGTRRDRDEDQEQERVAVQRKLDSLAPLQQDAMASEVEAVLQTPGYPLDRETRRDMESRIGFDFSHVRIHTDSRAASSARTLGARAFTVGNHVVFGRGRFSPRSSEGRHLLAHELTHVIQQRPESIRAVQAVSPPAAIPSRASRQVQRSPEEDAKNLSIGDLRHPIEALKKVATKIPGYELFTVIIGHDPITGAEVERSATNLVGGFLKLIGKQDTFDNLQKSGALDRAFGWLKDEVNQLGFSIDYFKGLINEAINSVGPGDVFDIAAALKRIYEIFKPPLIKAKDFASHVLNKVFEFIVQGVLDAAGATGVFDMLKKAGAAFSTIIKDPVAFLGHLVDALKQGFNQFKDNILEHLKNAVLDWLFGEIASTGITIPKPFNFAAVVNLLLQVLGLTYPKLRARLVKALGGEQPVVFLETSFEFLATIATKGLAAAWEMILQKADNLIETVLSAVKDWAITKIVTAAVASIVKLLNPAGAVIQAIQFIYEALRVFIEKAKQIAALISAIADSLAEIAAGNIAKAANFIETTMAKTLPIILNFLAGLVGLGGIGAKIREIIHNIQEKVGAAVDKVLNYIVEKGRALWETGKSAVASVVEWWKARKEFKLGDEKHTLYIEGDDGEHPQIMVESSPTTLELFLKNVGASEEDKTKILDLAKKIRWRKGELSDSTKPDKGQADFDALFEAISELKVKDEIPQSKITNLPGRQYGAGTGVTAFLSLRAPKGTSPNKRNDPDAWTDLGGLREKKSYVRGHLLNDRLGGLGEWENMMPLTNTSNGDFFRAMEKPVIDAVSTGKQFVWVKVEAKYKEGVVLPTNGSQEDKEKAAESRLLSLDWSYGPATYSGQWKEADKPLPDDIKPLSGQTPATR